MQRRKFLIFSSIFGLSSLIEAKQRDKFKKKFFKVKPVIAAVQEHMFPSHNTLPSAKAMHVTLFLYKTIIHKCYDRDIRAFVLEGAKELLHRNNDFIYLSYSEKEKILHEYEATEYGSAWLSRIMILSLEGILSDPIYGANINQAGWKALGALGGEPRPKSRYLSNV